MKRKMKKVKGPPILKVGMGHITYSGYGKHENKKRKALERIRRKECLQD